MLFICLHPSTSYPHTSFSPLITMHHTIPMLFSPFSGSFEVCFIYVTPNSDRMNKLFNCFPKLPNCKQRYSHHNKYFFQIFVSLLFLVTLYYLYLFVTLYCESNLTQLIDSHRHVKGKILDILLTTSNHLICHLLISESETSFYQTTY